MSSTRRRKHIPQRTCVGCRQVRPKREMVRIVRTPTEGVQIDDTGKRSGRGAYLCPNRACWETALSEGRLEYALQTRITPAEREALEAYAQALPASVGFSIH
ncbi:MAG: RNase P modulator RnpM [Anaerolineae bacterium]